MSCNRLPGVFPKVHASRPSARSTRRRAVLAVLAMAAAPVLAGTTTIDLQFTGVFPEDDNAAFTFGDGDQNLGIDLGRLPMDLFGDPAVALGLGNNAGEVGGSVHTGLAAGTVEVHIEYQDTVQKGTDPITARLSNIQLQLFDGGGQIGQQSGFNFVVRINGESKLSHNASIRGRRGSFEVFSNAGDLGNPALQLSDNGFCGGPGADALCLATLPFAAATYQLDTPDIAPGDLFTLEYEINMIVIGAGSETYADVSLFDPLGGGALKVSSPSVPAPSGTVLAVLAGLALLRRIACVCAS